MKDSKYEQNVSSVTLLNDFKSIKIKQYKFEH